MDISKAKLSSVAERNVKRNIIRRDDNITHLKEVVNVKNVLIENQVKDNERCEMSLNDKDLKLAEKEN